MIYRKKYRKNFKIRKNNFSKYRRIKRSTIKKRRIKSTKKFNSKIRKFLIKNEETKFI